MSASELARLAVDRTYLRTSQYASSDNLAARQSIYEYLDPPFDFYSWALDHVSWSGDERVLDVGCGNGIYLERLRRDRGITSLVGLDLSAGMAREVAARGDVVFVADASDLPFATGHFDVVLAMHMLYHVPDIDRCIRELRRVVRDGGIVLVATNHEDHMKQLTDLYLDAVAIAAGERSEVEVDPSSGLRFRLNDEGKKRLEQVFGAVETDSSATTKLQVTEVDAILDYIESTRGHREVLLPEGTMWEDVIRTIRGTATDVIARTGSFDISPYAGVFVCTRHE